MMGKPIYEDDPIVSLALRGIRPALISAQTGVSPSTVSLRLTAARKAGFPIPDFTAYRSERLSPDELARIERRTEARETTFPDRVRAFNPHADAPSEMKSFPSAHVISDQVGDTITPGPCAWCGGRIVAGARIRRLEREVGGMREVSRYCTACIVAMASGTDDVQQRREMGRPR